MRYLLLTAFLLTGLSGIAQGLNYELSYNPGYYQYPSAVKCDDQYTFVAWSAHSQGFSNSNWLEKIDTTGNVLWSSPISAFGGEFKSVHDLERSENGGVYVAGHVWTTCDVSQGCYWYLQKYTSSGSVDWTVTFDDYLCYNDDVQVTLVDDTLIYVSANFWGDSTKVMRIGTNASFYDSLTIPIKDVVEFEHYSSSEFMAVGGANQDIYTFDANGDTIASYGVGSPIIDFSKRNDTLFVLTDNGMTLMDIGFNVFDQTTISSHGSLNELRTDLGGIQLLGHLPNAIHHVSLDEQLQELNFTATQLDNQFNAFTDFSESHIGVAQNINLYSGNAVRIIDFSLTDPINATVNYTDAGVIGAEINDMSLGGTASGGVYSLDLYCTVHVMNYGPNPMTSVRLNKYLGMGICNANVYTQDFSGFTVAPGDSIWIDVGWIGHQYYIFPPPSPDTLVKDICFYTSHPNHITDLSLSNDNGCTSQIIGYASVSNEEINTKIYPNPTADYLNLELSELEEGEIIIRDISGKVILLKSISSKNSSFDLSFLADGTYFLTILNSDDQVLHTEKIQIMK